MRARNERPDTPALADVVDPSLGTRSTLAELSDEPSFRRYIAADPERERVARSGSCDEIARLVAAYPAYAQAEREHYEAIVAAHPNFAELWQEPAFDAFVEAVGDWRVVESGSAEEIIDLLDRYLVARPRPEQLVSEQEDSEPRITVEDNPRAWHALTALRSGPKRREEIDRVAGVSNGPDLISDLRRDYGLSLPCALVDHIDRYGKKVKKGVYSLADGDRSKVERLLRVGREAPAPYRAPEVGGYASLVTSLVTPALEKLRGLCPEEPERGMLEEVRDPARELAQWLESQPGLPPLPPGNLIDAFFGASAGGE